MDNLKVIFHINEPARWQRVLLNANNFVKDVGQENIDAEIVANGDAVTAYFEIEDASSSSEKLNENLYEKMNKLSKMGIRFAACRNALRMHSLDEQLLPPFVTAVPAGITEIAKKQAEGYAYIKP